MAIHNSAIAGLKAVLRTTLRCIALEPRSMTDGNIYWHSFTVRVMDLGSSRMVSVTVTARLEARFLVDRLSPGPIA